MQDPEFSTFSKSVSASVDATCKFSVQDQLGYPLKFKTLPITFSIKCET